MTDASGTVVWAADYKPFGEASITVSTITNNLRFPGQYYDAETGLNYKFFRDYNPVIGRYIEADSLGIEQGANHLFAYVGNNPLNETDPLGLSKRKDECDKAIARIEGILGHGDHHDDTGQSQKANCAQLQNELSRFTSNNCGKYRPDLLNAANAFMNKNCKDDKPKQCEDKSKCVKKSTMVAVGVGGYIVYKIVEVLFCPYLVPVTP